MLKMYTKDNKWVIEDNGRNVIFDSSTDAWAYAFLMREIRPKAPWALKSIYPVRSLNPFPTMGTKKIIQRSYT